MIGPFTDLSKQYAEALPFPHHVFDNFWYEEELRAAVDQIRLIKSYLWQQRDHEAQQKKLWVETAALLPEALKRVLVAMNSYEFVRFISELTGIENLLPDPTYLGGGLHRVLPGGKLAIHADFNWHPQLKLHRRVNALLYLNADWQEEWGGHLELWERDMSRCAVKLAPAFNRLVVFTITDTAFHGHPEPLASPAGVDRLAFALYYYTKERPAEEISSPHWATWQVRPTGQL